MQRCRRLLQRGDRVVGLDNLNDYYDPGLKQARLRQIEAVAGLGQRFERLAGGCPALWHCLKNGPRWW